ncbi:MAG TPA: amino acid adenylation domain-containing protein [Pyrinomonadaceae bacterium]|nr:amino acid adenylation domain-containing protein [Pyrinomonadaceae bacterium]
MSFQSVQEMFSRMAVAFGPHAAIDRKGRTVTYSELESQSNRLANFLLEGGVTRGSIVGIFTDDPILIITSILGVLKAGAVFVPLDPTFPEQRLQVMSEQVQPVWYVVENKHLTKLSRMRAEAIFKAAFITFGRESSKVVCLDGPPDGPLDSFEASGVKVLDTYTAYDRTQHPGVPSDPDAPCSIYFTSGSTGKPKAILGRLKGIDHFIRWEIEAVGATAGTRVTQLSSPSFDGFLKDAFVPLCSGGTVCAPENRDVILDAEKLADWIDEKQIEVLHCVPSVFRALVNKGLDPKSFTALKHVVMTGEPLYPADVKRWMQVFGDRIKLLNIYGTTETTLSKFTYEVKPEDVERPSIPVGKPIKGSAVMIMDSALRPCREGAVGEIYIRTPYRSHGYYGEPDLTKEVFIQNPFTDDPNDVVYKTGDFGRLLEDGSLEILGRRDGQVQVRGVRVELGEVENLLRLHSAVADVAVIDRDDGDGNKFLVAYVTMNNGAGSEHLRQYLAERLPSTMLPSAFVEMEELPRTLNGKIDRKALPALEVVQQERAESELLPRTPIEEIVAAIWREVLKLPVVGRTDNFFNLGGHSLLATQVILRLRDTLKVELPVRSMFESSTIEQLSALIQEQISDGRQQTPEPIEVVPRTEKLAPSFAQQRLWVQEQLTRGSDAFHLALGAKLEGQLNVPALEQTFGEIIRRHESLRTSFPMIDGALVQKISPPAKFAIPIVDLRGFDEVEQETISRRLAQSELSRPFDLDSGPLARGILIRHRDDQYTIICTLHHIISDGWSRGVMVREISTVYEAFLGAEPSPLAELPIQYADFAEWQRRRLQGDALEQDLNYWKEKLAGAPPLLALPTDRPRPAIQTYRGATLPFVLSQQLTEQLRNLSQRRGMTLFMTLLAAFQTLLFRYSAQEDIVVGTTAANRERSDIEGLIGFFVNMLALRTDFSGNPRFEDLLEQVREATFKAYVYQGVPFERLVQELQPRRNPSYSPVFQVVFSFQNQPTLVGLTLPGLTLSVPHVELTTSQFDLLLDLSEGAEGLAGTLQYNSDLFDRATIVRVAEHFRNLLEGIAAHPEQRLSELPLQTESERLESVVEWNQTAAEYPRDVCIHELFARVVEQQPDAVAAVFNDEQLSYTELDRRSNQLAHYLKDAGVRAGDLVGICLDHSLAELVGLLGVLKAGAGYVPVDPEHPLQRLAFMLADSGVSTVLTQRRFVEALAPCGSKLICIDRDWPSIAAQSSSVCDTATPADSVAYVIYTSGSTGEPKGVCVTHRSLVDYAWWAKDVYLQNESLAFALYSSIAFDLTVTSIFVPLITGNKVVIYRWAEKQAPLEQILNDKETGVLKLTPSHLALIKDRDNRQSSIKRLIVGGENFETDLARQVHESFGGQVEIFNEYGPTEATVGCMIYQFDPVRDQRQGVPIGRPAANAQLYVLDKWLRPAAVNVTGELCIAGDGLAQGYLNRAALTAEKFIANPFASGQRMYRTGDLARMLPDGNIEYLGRRDQQVKFHGYRVELNEIQGALKQHPQIRDSVVMIRSDKQGNDVMVAYYVSRQELEVAEIRAFLAERLIGETIPNLFVHLRKLPLTLNGKINYQALPSLEEAREKLQRTYTAPRSPQEESVAAIWAEVLSMERVGIHENFFTLGGHSLLATQIIHRINQTFEIDLPMRVMFDDPTIAALSLLIEEALIEQLEAVPN